MIFFSAGGIRTVHVCITWPLVEYQASQWGMAQCWAYTDLLFTWTVIFERGRKIALSKIY